MKQNCELCGKKARMYCESDQASLCWECDAKVHSANFLVAKHSRCLLCDVCQSPTPWNASGEKFGPTISVCEGCFDTHNKRSEMDHHGPDSDDCSVNGDDHNSSDDEDEDSYEEEDEEEAERDEEEEGENQVVPWSSNYSPPATSSSIRGEESLTDRSVGGPLAAKRNWNDAFLDSEDEIGCASSSSQGRARSVTAIADEEEARISPSSFRPFRQQRVIVKEGENDSAAESKSTSIVTSLARLQKNAVMTQGDATASAHGIFGLSQ